MPRKIGALRTSHVGLGMETAPLFEIEPTPVGKGLGLTDAGVKRRSARPPAVRSSLKTRPAWSPYYGVPQPCSEGVRLEYDRARNGTVGAGHTTHARYRRVLNGEVTLMCKPCAERWRQLDGFTTALPARRAPQPRKAR
jgi:hypothetical protein